MGSTDGSKATGEQPPSFSESEVKQMEKLLMEEKDELLDEKLFWKLTEEFNLGRAGNKVIQMEQVQSWFQDKMSSQASENIHSSPIASEEMLPVSDTSLSNNAPESSSDLHKGTKDKIPDITELEFEARSTRDGAWYDVAMFLAHRVLVSGELEVRVRFQGFGAEDDEWVNVKKAIRERSIPLESSECRKVAVGDLVLCFRESSEEAIYFDAHVLEIQRKLHDIRGCRCLFLIRYEHDQTEEKVHLRRLCRRPNY